MVDKIFKIGILLLVAVFLFLYSQNIQKDRYSLYGRLQAVFDTQTGKIYLPNGEVWNYGKGKTISPKKKGE